MNSVKILFKGLFGTIDVVVCADLIIFASSSFEAFQ